MESKKNYHSKPIVDKIKDYYGVMQQVSEKRDIVKDAIKIPFEAHVEKLMEDDPDFNPKQPYFMNGMVLKQRPNISYEYDPEIKSEARNIGYLQKIVKVREKSEGFYNLEPFRTYQEEYVKPIPVGMKRKTEEEKELAAKERSEKVENYAELPMDKLLSIYNELNTQLKELKEMYEKDKSLLLHAMTVDKIEKIPIDEIIITEEDGSERIIYHEGSYFKKMNNEMNYDNMSIATNQIEKYELFLIEIDEENKYKYHVTDLLSGKRHEVSDGDKVPFEHCNLEVHDAILFVNNNPVEVLDPKDNEYMKKREYKKIVKNGGGLFIFSRMVDGLDFLEDCEISSKGLEEILLDASIDQSFISKYKKMVIDPEKDLIFEVMSEEDYKKISDVFSEIQTQKGQIRRMNSEMWINN